MSFPHVSEADPRSVPAEPVQNELGSPFRSSPSGADIRGTWLELSLDTVSAGDFISTFLFLQPCLVDLSFALNRAAFAVWEQQPCR